MISKQFLLVQVFLFPAILSFAQLNGSYNVGSGQTYTTLTGVGGLFEAINNNGLSGNVTANIISDITENSTYGLEQWTEYGGSGYTLIIKPDGTTMRTISGTTTGFDDLISIDGADRVTIDGQSGKYLTFRNTNSTATSTAPTIAFYLGSTSCTLTNCYIENNMDKFNSGAVKVFTGGLASNEVIISNCNIHDATAGTTGPVSCGIYCNSTGSTYTNTVTISNNNIYNYSSSIGTAYGIRFNDEDGVNGTSSNCNASGNSFYYNLSPSPLNHQYALYIVGGEGHTVSGNYFGGQSSACGGSPFTNTGSSAVFSAISVNNMASSSSPVSIENNTIKNISIAGFFYGIYLYRVHADIDGNIIGHPSTTNSIVITGSQYARGIYDDNPTYSSYANTITDNTIANITHTGATVGNTLGILLVTKADVSVERNKIYKIGPQNGTTDYSWIQGFYIENLSGGSPTYTLVNNVVALGAGTETGSDWSCINDYSYTGATVNLYYNTFYLAGTSNDDANQWTACFWRDNGQGTSVYNLKNNIVYNSRSDAGWDDEVLSMDATGSITSDYNILYAPDGVVAYYGGSSYTTLANWQTVSSQDANSWSEDALFTNAGSNDLSLQVSNNTGTYLASYLTDINGTTRSTSTPDAGAYENTTDEYITFDGSTDNTWETAANWTPEWVTSGLYGVDIPNGKSATINSTGNEVRKLDINNGGTLTINAAKDLTSNGTTTLGGAGCLVIESSSGGTGSFIDNGTISGAGTATVKRYLTDNSWHLVTPSTTGVTAANFYWGDNPKSWLLSHDESQTGDPSWTYITNTATALNVGQGYMVWLDLNTKSPATATMTGALRSSDLSVSLEYSGSGVNQGWNLIGNPFASAIDKDEGTWGSITTGTVYVWDNDYDGDGEYLTSGLNLTGNIIPMGQGFFVKSTEAGSFTIPSAARVHSTQAFYKNATIVERPFVNLALTTGAYKSEVLVGFPEDGTTGFDMNLDADRLYGSLETPQMIIPEGDRILCINASSPLVENEPRIVPLHVMFFIDGEYNLDISDLDQLPGVQITLEDLATGASHDFSKNNTYLFSAKAGDDPARFLLHFKSNAYGIDDPGSDRSNNLNIYSWGNTIYVQSKGDAINHEGVLRLYDMTGRFLTEKQVKKGELVSFTFNYTNTYLIARIIKENDTKTTKIFIN